MKELSKIRNTLGEIREILNGLAEGNYNPQRAKDLTREARADMDEAILHLERVIQASSAGAL